MDNLEKETERIEAWKAIRDKAPEMVDFLIETGVSAHGSAYNELLGLAKVKETNDQDVSPADIEKMSINEFAIFLADKITKLRKQTSSSDTEKFIENVKKILKQ